MHSQSNTWLAINWVCSKALHRAKYVWKLNMEQWLHSMYIGVYVGNMLSNDTCLCMPVQ